jgi:zinc transporter 2
MVALIAVTISLTVESIRRISKLISSSAEGVEDAVDGKMMTILAVIGISLNVVLACVLGEHHVHMPTEKCHGLNHTHEHGHCHSHNEGKTWIILMELYCM